MTKNWKPAVRSDKPRTGTVEPVMVWFCQFQNLPFWSQKLHRFDSPKFGARDLMLRIISNFILNRLESVFQVKLTCRAKFRNGCIKCLIWKKKKKKRKEEIVGSYGGERKRKKNDETRDAIETGEKWCERWAVTYLKEGKKMMRTEELRGELRWEHCLLKNIKEWSKEKW